jgi:oxygen-independent coproporphyrinogen-3 oxidase
MVNLVQNNSLATVRRRELVERAKARLEDFNRLKAAGLICQSGDFFPSVHYPPITMYPEMTEEELFKDYTLPEDGMFDIYVHIPFCRRHCTFCHYPVVTGASNEEKYYYLQALEKEMDIYMNRLGIDKIKARSILIGGGTPTYLTLEQQKWFFDFFVERVELSECSQFNYDVDPVTLIGSEGIQRLEMMKSYGVDRLTIGVQSLNDRVLKLMNRHHGSKEALEAIALCHAMGYQLDIEFIFGYPGQNLDNWLEVMEQAVTLDVEEIQLYRLKIEAYGDFQGVIKKVTEVRLEDIPTNEDAIMMKQIALDILNENGYQENLRRVFTKEGKHYSHYADNQCCGLLDQLGFGQTAFSSLRDRFGLNTQNFDEYYAKIAAGKLPLNRGYVRTPEEQARWAVILPLKNRCVWKTYFTKVTGGASLNEVFGEKIEALKSFGLLEEDSEKIQLTRLGAFFADEVAQQFHHPNYLPFPSEAYAQGRLHPCKHQPRFL